MSMTCLASLALSLACFLTASGTVFVAGYALKRWSVTVLLSKLQTMPKVA